MLVIKALCGMLLVIGVIIMFYSLIKMRSVTVFAEADNADEIRAYTVRLVSTINTVLGAMVAGVSGVALVL